MVLQRHGGWLPALRLEQRLIATKSIHAQVPEQHYTTGPISQLTLKRKGLVLSVDIAVGVPEICPSLCVEVIWSQISH